MNLPLIIPKVNLINLAFFNLTAKMPNYYAHIINLFFFYLHPLAIYTLSSFDMLSSICYDWISSNYGISLYNIYKLEEIYDLSIVSE